MNVQEQQTRLLALGIETEISQYGDITPIGPVCSRLEEHGFEQTNDGMDPTIMTYETSNERCNIIACHPPMIEIFPITPAEMTLCEY